MFKKLLYTNVVPRTKSFIPRKIKSIYPDSIIYLYDLGIDDNEKINYGYSKKGKIIKKQRRHYLYA